MAIDRPETQFAEDVDMYSSEVYVKAHDMLWDWVKEGRFVQDEQPMYYVYELVMDGCINDRCRCSCKIVSK